MSVYRNIMVGFLTLGTGLGGMASVAQAALNIPLTVNMSEAVTVDTTGGTPRIAVDVGGNTRYATYTSGSGTSALTFTLTPTVGDVDLDGVSVSSPVDLNGGTIKDAIGNNATLTFTPPNTSGIKVDYPSLSMDFVNGDYIFNGTHYATMPSFLTAAGGSFTRASIGTYYDSSGVLQTASSGTPRFDYDPVTHTAKGMLIEEQRTNYILKSAQFDLAGWLKNGSYVTADVAAAPDGTTTAEKLIANNGVTGRKAVYQQVNLTAGNKYTFSVYLKKAEFTTATIWFDETTLSEGTYFGSGVLLDLSSGTSQNSAQVQITPVGNNWYRCSVSATPTSTTSYRVDVGIGYPNGGDYTGNNVSGIYVWGAQIEQGSFPTSYIPTTTATVTRGGDNLSFSSGAALTQMQSSTGTFRAETDMLLGGVYSKIISNSSSGLLEVGGTLSQVGTVGSGGPYFTANIGSGAVNTSPVKSAVTWTSSARALAGNGGGVVTGAGTLNTRDAVYIGSKAQLGNYIDGDLRSLRFYPSAVSNTQLQLLTQ